MSSSGIAWRRKMVWALTVGMISTLSTESMAQVGALGGGNRDVCSVAPSLPCRDRVERYRALGLPEARLVAFLSSGRSLSDWHNREHIGGEQARIAGWLILGLSALTTTLSVAMIMSHRRSSRGEMSTCSKWLGCDDPGWGINIGPLGYSFLLIGLVGVGFGLPMTLVAEFRMRRWIKGDWLDRAPIEQLKEHRSPASRAGGKASLYPYFTRGGGGAVFSLRF